MEQTTFADASVMDYMHRHFFCIKIDKETHPSLNAWYTQSLQNMGIATGWPLHAFCLPNLLPFLGGTYFSKKDWMALLKHVLYVYHHHRPLLEKSAGHFSKMPTPPQFHSASPQVEIAWSAYLQSMLQALHPLYGSIKKDVQFPLTTVYQVLLASYAITHIPSYLVSLNNILQSISSGGIYDHLTGGFARYALDEKWKIPHFEKMLADNALLLDLYAKAHHCTQAKYTSVIKKTLQWIEDIFFSATGGYYNTLDADSEGIEGQYYTWTIEEIQQVLSPEAAAVIIQHYQITAKGNWQKGYNVLYKTKTPDPTAQVLLSKAEKKLCQVRQKRIAPALEKKKIVAHNAMLLQSFVSAYHALKEKKILQKAVSLATVLWQHIQQKKIMKRMMEADVASSPGTLIDYAWVIQAYVALYQATFSLSWLDKAKSILEDVLIFFYDVEDGFFFESPRQTIPNFLQAKYLTDDVYPNANAILGYQLYKIGSFYNNERYHAMATKMYQNVASQLQSSPILWASWSKLCFTQQDYTPLFMIIGKDALQVSNTLHMLYPGPKMIAGTYHPQNALPILSNKPWVADTTMIYTCVGKTCLPPTTYVSSLLHMLKKRFISKWS